MTPLPPRPVAPFGDPPIFGPVLPVTVVLIPGKGRGVVALAALDAGTRIELAPCIALTVAEEDAAAATRFSHYYYEVSRRWIATRGDYGALLPLGLATLCNHADDPNALLEFHDHPLGPLAELSTNRAIAAGEEITLRYHGGLWFDPVP